MKYLLLVILVILLGCGSSSSNPTGSSGSTEIPAYVQSNADKQEAYLEALESSGDEVACTGPGCSTDKITLGGVDQS